MIKNKILSIFVLFITFSFPFFTYADAHTFMTSKIDSDWGDGFCYKFNLWNESNETIFSWKINFDLPEWTQISWIRWGKQTKNGSKYTITWLDRNSNLNIGHKWVEVWFCANGSKRPTNVVFLKWEKKHSQKHYTNNHHDDDDEDEDDVDYEYNVDEDADEPSEVCYVNTAVVSKTNLVKNGWFEIFNTGNVFSDWFKKRKEDYNKFVWKLSKLEYWTALNNNYKIWKNADIKAQEWESFVDIDYGNTLSQDIKTGSGKKYELSFYSLGTDELEVKWNGKSIHKKANTYTWVNITQSSGSTMSSGSVDYITHMDTFSFENKTVNTFTGINLLPTNITAGWYVVNWNVYNYMVTTNWADIYKVTGSLQLSYGHGYSRHEFDDLDFKKWNDILDVGTLNVDVEAGEGNDMIRVSTANRSIYTEEGNDTLQFNNNAGYIEAWEWNDNIKIVWSANNSIYLWQGTDQIDIGWNASKIYGDEWDKSIRITWNANNNITTEDGDDNLFIGWNASYIDVNNGENNLFINGNANTTIDLWEDSDTIIINGGVNGTINLWNGDNHLSVGWPLNGRLNFWEGKDSLVLKWTVDNAVYLNNGNDSVVVYASNFNNTIYGGSGEDSIYLKNISSTSWNSNQNNIKSKVNSFEKFIFSDGVEIGFEDDEVVTSTGIIEENYSSGIQNKAGWVKYTYNVDGISGSSKLDFSNTKVIFEDEKENLQGNNYCNKFKNENSCESWVAKSICKWEDNNCIKKDSYKYAYNCWRNNGGWIINLSYEKITIPKGKNKINCNVWWSSRKLYTWDGDDYVRYKFGDNAYINLGGWSNIFTHNIYDSQFTNSTIEWGGGFNKLIIEDEDFENFDVTGDCSTECTLSLKNNIFNWWQGWRFSNIKLKRIHEISCKNSKKEFKSDKSSDYLFETDVRLGLDNVQIREITTSSNIDKIDLMTLINDILKNNVTNGSCTDIFYWLEESIKSELIQKLLNSSDYSTIALDFLNTVSDSSKLNVVKNISYELIKDKISPCHTDAEKEAFYNELFAQTETAIDTCVINNINAQVKKQIDNINYLQKTVNSCTQSGNTLTLNFLNSYWIYSK